MMSSPGTPLEVTSVQGEVNPRCGTKVSSPSRPQGASPSPRSPGSLVPPGIKRLRCSGEVESLPTGLRSSGQSGYVRLELAAPRCLPEGPRAATYTRFSHLHHLPNEAQTFRMQGRCSGAVGFLLPPASAASLPTASHPQMPAKAS